MDQEQSSSGRRKGKFTPRAPPQRKRSPTVPKSEVNDTNTDEDRAAQSRKLMAKFNENLRRKVPQIEKKSSVQVAFGPGAIPSASIRKYGVPSGENAGSNKRSEIDASANEEGELVVSSLSTANEDGAIIYHPEAIDALPLKIKKDYREPWDYDTYYPTTLPLRPPGSGDPEKLDEEEFGDAARSLEYDEKTIKSALDLGLLEESDRARMFFFQLPPKLPIVNRSASIKGKEKAEGSTHSQGNSASKKESFFEGLSGGYMGNMLVYRSGKVKLKLGDILFDVNPGMACTFYQNVAAVDTEAKRCCNIGELEKQTAVVSPDIGFLLDSEQNAQQ